LRAVRKETGKRMTKIKKPEAKYIAHDDDDDDNNNNNIPYAEYAYPPPPQVYCY